MTTQSIFIVEAEIITATSIAKNLKNLGYKVAGIATTGSKAIAQILNVQPDLILMDILLKKSDIDGITIVKRIQEKSNIPVVYLTAHSDDTTLERAQETTPLGYILKPFSQKDLQIAIKMALHKHHQQLQLIEPEQLLSTILESTQDCVIATNREFLPWKSVATAGEQAQEKEPISGATEQEQNLATSIAETKLNELSSHLIDLVVHELRAPLTIILSTSESLRLYRHRWTEEKQNQSFDRIQKAIQQMTKLLDDVSVWEQAGAGKLLFQPEVTDVVSVCKELLLDLQFIDRGNHQLIFTHQVNEPQAYVDESLLRYVLNNLLLNAIKYSPLNTTIDLILDRQSDCLVFQVRDRGMGIALEEQTYLFDSFYRASNVGHIPGTGLGLAIAKMCLELHHGQISLESEIGIGSTFTVTLPIAGCQN